MKTAVYMRVSRADQDISLQEREISSFLQYKGTTEYLIYKDEGYSGKNTSRPALKSMLDALNSGTISEIVIWKLDRLGRNLSDLLRLTKTFQEKGAILRTVKDNIDTSTINGTLFMHLLGAFAQYERSLIVERTKSGLAVARAKGKIIGRPSKMTASNKTTMLSLRAQGKSYSAISKELGINIGSVHHFLTSVKTLDTLNQSNESSHGILIATKETI